MASQFIKITHTLHTFDGFGDENLLGLHTAN